MDTQKAFDDFFRNLDYNASEVKEGKILLSEPFLNDPNFARSVVFLVKHNEEGSLGFVLNHASEFSINTVIEDFPRFETQVYLGGPVGRENLFYLHTRNDLITGGVQVLDDLYWGGDFDEVKEAVRNEFIQPDEILFFVGYSGWDAGQLDAELDMDSWIVTDITIDELMKGNPEKLWNKKLKQLGETYKILSNFPMDPTWN